MKFSLWKQAGVAVGKDSNSGGERSDEYENRSVLLLERIPTAAVNLLILYIRDSDKGAMKRRRP